jgi:hypothetical protein
MFTINYFEIIQKANTSPLPGSELDKAMYTFDEDEVIKIKVDSKTLEMSEREFVKRMHGTNPLYTTYYIKFNIGKEEYWFNTS